MNEMTSHFLPLRKREEITNRWLFHRLNTLLPTLMKKHGVGMWITIGREYHEDPALLTLFPSAVDSSRRLTILVFTLEGGILKRSVIHTNPEFEPFYERVWNPATEDQWECLVRLIKEKDPATIALNTSEGFASCDGLTHTLHSKLAYLVPGFTDRFISAEPLLIEWYSTRSQKELTAYPFIAESAREIAESALSRSVIHPGITTTDDVVEWIRQKVLDLGLKTSFYPTVDLQRKGAAMDRIEGEIIRPGDIVHLDFGIEYLGLATDTQQLAYVLFPDEEQPPQGLISAFNKALRMGDIIMEELKPGVPGNDVFRRSMARMDEEELNGMIYTHPIGVHCHEAGALIGLYDLQGPVPIKGELPVTDQTLYALEFNCRDYIPEWGQEVPIYLEEPVGVIRGKAEYMAKRQTGFYLI